MRRLIADLYKMVYKLTNSKLISLPFSILYISLLNTITIYGLCLLLADGYPVLGSVAVIFRPPFNYGIFLLIAAFNFWMMLPLQNLSKEKSKPITFGPVIIYSLACFCILMYIRYADRLF